MRERSVPGLSPWLVGACSWPHMAFSQYVYICDQISPFYDISHIALGWMSMTYINLITWVKILHPYKVTFYSTRVRLPTYKFGLKGHNSTYKQGLSYQFLPPNDRDECFNPYFIMTYILCSFGSKWIFLIIFISYILQ